MAISQLFRRPPATGPTVRSINFWMSIWHSVFYVLLIGITGSVVWRMLSARAEVLLILALALLLALWYCFCVAIYLTVWKRHPVITIGYLAIGAGIWFALARIDDLYSYMLMVLFAQICILLPGLWKLVSLLVLTALMVLHALLAGSDPGVVFLIASLTFGTLMAAFFIEASILQNIEKDRILQEKDRLLHELETTQQALAVASQQAGVIAERQRLAHEIHDTLAQGFTSIIMHVEAVEGTKLTASSGTPETLWNTLDQIREAARENLLEARRLLWALSPQALERASLPDVLDDLARKWSAEHAIAASTAVTGSAQTLQPEIEVTLLRAAQEALNNVRKHALASEVTLTLSYMDDTVILDVQDNGTGFDPTQEPAPLSEVAGGFGLRALRERAARLGGQLSIESAAGEGTTLALALPALQPFSTCSEDEEAVTFLEESQISQEIAR
jgi:signal transduction histidine kinase